MSTQTTVDTLTEKQVGAWTPFHSLTPNDKDVFETATGNITGVTYTPTEVSTQVVNGTNYRFLADAQIVYPGAKPFKVVVTVYAPLNGAPVLEGIEPLLQEESGIAIPGGWTPFHALTSKDKEVFDAVMKSLVGVSYTPTEVSTQVVQGINYRFLCNAQRVEPNPKPYKALVTIYAPLEGRPVLVKIERLLLS